MKRHRKSDCPIHFALEVFGDAWTLLIVRDLMFKGGAGYRDFLKGGEGIATNVLADRLSRLEENGIVKKEPSPRGKAGRYRLTPMGLDLLPILLEMIRWSAKYDPRTAADPAFVRKLRSDPEGLKSEILTRLRATDSRAGRPGQKASHRGEKP